MNNDYTSPMLELESRRGRQDTFTSPRLEQLDSLLVYLTDYGILICKPCRFAVQPKAIQSHLLRHHIYRDKRRKILDRVAGLTLMEPDEVPIPSPKVPAFPHLPIGTGYRCMLENCGHLCISHKRMSQHLREYHGDTGCGDLEGYAQQAHLQTFFRGNKVRYFEVNPDVSETHRSAEQPRKYQFLDLPQSKVDETLSPRESMDNNPNSLEETALTPQQMEQLMYLHQYITCTGLSLTRGTDPTSFWIHDVPLQAANQTFLMHGILGVAAFHKALLASDRTELILHRSAGLRHQSAGLATFRRIIGNPTRQNSTALSAFARLLGVQFCEEALLDAGACISEANTSANSGISKILEFLLLLKGGCDLLLNMQDLLPTASGLILSGKALQGLEPLEIPPEALQDVTPHLVNETFAWLCSAKDDSASSGESFRVSDLSDVRDLVDLCIRVSKLTEAQHVTVSWMGGIVPTTSRLTNHVHLLTRAFAFSWAAAKSAFENSQSEGHAVPCPILLCYPHIPPAMYLQLASLPTRITTRVSKTNYLDLKAFDHALAALVSSFSRSYTEDAAWARWNGLESWARMLSDRFLSMIEARDPPALVLVAYWCVLLSRQENSYWFLQGQAQRMLNIVLANLDARCQDLVRDCLSSLT